MKTSLVNAILIIAVLSLSLTSCKTNRRPFIGEYTYQTSGSLSIGLATEDIDIPITDRMGQMQIMKGDEKGKITIIKASLTGEIKQLTGSISGDEITIDEYTYEKEIKTDSINGKAKLNYTAKGRLRDNTIVLEDNYSGFYRESKTGIVGTIRGNNVLTLIKKND